MSEFKTYNEQGKEIQVTNEDFKLVQTDEKIHDVKFESKPTTFWKDAFKRFCKNKSSVVATYIIGVIILLAIFFPIFSPHNVDSPRLAVKMLPPKMFSAGTGFWDGTKTYKNVVYDAVNEEPAEFKGDCVLEYTNKRDEKIDTTNQYAYGGTFIFLSDNDVDQGADFTEHYYAANFQAGLDQKITISLSGKDDLVDYEKKMNYVLGSYRVVLMSGKEVKVVLKDWSNDYSEFTLNISEALQNANITEVVNGKIRLELLPYSGQPIGDNPVNSYIGINSIKFTYNANLDTAENKELLDNLSFDNANLIVMTSKGDTALVPQNYWQSSGKRLVTGTTITYVDFVYDCYAAQLGLMESVVVGGSTMNDYIKNGWCEYDYSIGPSSFKVLNKEKCPITKVIEQKYSNKDGYYTLTCDIIKYKEMGYTSMPSFWFGTDINGYDLITLCFRGLRSSLILAVCASSVCILFGLCWGSISGYFGGNVDLIMERFCDILGGVPWTVLMTLAILLMGQSWITFALALCLTGWMGIAARTRTQFYRFKGREYIYASRTLGAKDGRLIFKHILPNAMGTIITSAVLMIPSTIFSETSLSYLGLLTIDNSFGNILSKNQSYLSSQPTLIIFPAVIISLIMISFNLFGNGLRDALNPSLKGSE